MIRFFANYWDDVLIVIIFAMAVVSVMIGGE